jgi:hypothetical protein
MVMYSPLTIATEGGGVAVGGIGVAVGIVGVGVFGGAKSDAQALNPNARTKIKVKFNMRDLENIPSIIPIKNPHPLPLSQRERGWGEGKV